jgi:acyl dehydratase
VASTVRTRALTSAPCSIELYAKAALPLIPGASALPFVPGGGGKRIPRTRWTLNGVKADAGQLAAYDRVCGFTLRDQLPSTYIHVKAFPLHMALMTDGAFPFAPVGLVHLRNRITQHRPVLASEALHLTVFTMPTQPHAKGTAFTIVSEARVGDELVWQDASTMLRRSRGDKAAPPLTKADPKATKPQDLPLVAEWKLPESLGRQYAAASGDRNPIHMHALSAKLLGFPKAIAHGMWTKARCLAALEATLPDAYTVDVQFRRPILLPGKVAFAAEDGAFAVRSAKDQTKIHLEGTVSAP